LKLSLPEPVEGNIPAENHLRQAQVAMNCVTPIANKIDQYSLWIYPFLYIAAIASVFVFFA
jgi:hypothetical protein